MWEEHLASHKELYVFGSIVIQEFDKSRAVASKAVFLYEEWHEDAFHAEKQIFALGAIPHIIREVECHFALHTMCASYMSYSIYFLVIYHT